MSKNFIYFNLKIRRAIHKKKHEAFETLETFEAIKVFETFETPKSFETLETFNKSLI